MFPHSHLPISCSLLYLPAEPASRLFTAVFPLSYVPSPIVSITKVRRVHKPYKLQATPDSLSLPSLPLLPSLPGLASTTPSHAYHPHAQTSLKPLSPTLSANPPGSSTGPTTPFHFPLARESQAVSFFNAICNWLCERDKRGEEGGKRKGGGVRCGKLDPSVGGADRRRRRRCGGAPGGLWVR